MKYIIVGGVAGGATAAARIRRNDENAQIVLFEKGSYISYANCGLPYYVGGIIPELNQLILQTPESFGQRYYIDVFAQTEVIAIDPVAHTVTVRHKDKERTESYDKLLLSPGATPVRPPLPGITLPGIFTLRNVADIKDIDSFIVQTPLCNAVVVGGGFIGLEMAENLSTHGVQVTVVEAASHVMMPLDAEMASHVQSHLVGRGIHVVTGQAVAGFTARPEEGKASRQQVGGGVDGSVDGSVDGCVGGASQGGVDGSVGNRVGGVQLSDGRILPADLVILSIGVRPETTLARAAGLELGTTGGIRVDAQLRTSAPDIYAVGDAIEFPHPITGKPWLNFLAGPANRQARLVADQMTGGTNQATGVPNQAANGAGSPQTDGVAGMLYEGSIGTAVAKIFSMTLATTGLAAHTLEKEGIAYRSSITHSPAHAGYYPGAKPMSIKLTFHPTSGRLYGAQIVGFDGVDKRIDVIAQIIKHGGTVTDLTQVEHAYAPPFSSAKDPVAVAGYVAENILLGKVRTITWEQMRAAVEAAAGAGAAAPASAAGAGAAAPASAAGALAATPLLLDVRTPKEFEEGAIPGALNLPLDELRERLDELQEHLGKPQEPLGKSQEPLLGKSQNGALTDRPIYVYCAIGLRGYLASRILLQNGFTNVYNLSGGYRTYLSVCP